MIEKLTSIDEAKARCIECGKEDTYRNLTVELSPEEIQYCGMSDVVFIHKGCQEKYIPGAIRYMKE